MDLSSPEAQAILRYYSAAYDEVLFYEFQLQVGKYVSGLVLTDKIQECGVLMRP